MYCCSLQNQQKCGRLERAHEAVWTPIAAAPALVKASHLP